MAEGVHNKALLLSRAPIGLLLYSAFERLCPLIPQARERMLKAHDNVTRAISDGNSADAELWMRKHIIDFRRGWEMAALSLDLRVELPRAVAES